MTTEKTFCAQRSGCSENAGSGCGVRGAGCGVRGAGCGVRGAGCGVRGAGCGVRGVGCGLRGHKIKRKITIKKKINK